MSVKIACPRCEFINKLFNFDMTNREYWIMTELFVYLHDGNDFCKKETKHENLYCSV